MKKITRRNLDKFLEKYATNEKVLDIGSGGSAYHKFFPNRLAVDIDPKRKPDIVADAHSLPFNDGEFEVVLSTEMLEHVIDPFKVESELRRVTKKGGILILSTRFVFPLHDVPHDYWRFTKYGLRKLFSNWDIVELVGETKTFSTIGALIQRIIFQTHLRFNKLSKCILMFIAWLFTKLDFLLIDEYGDIKKSVDEVELMPTGYYIVCRKK